MKTANETKKDPHRTGDGDQGRVTAETVVTTDGLRGLERLRALTKRILKAPQNPSSVSQKDP